jgi:hypothetical protein
VVIAIPSSTAALLISMHNEKNLQFNINRHRSKLTNKLLKTFNFIMSTSLHYKFIICMWVQPGSPHHWVSSCNDRRPSFVVWPIIDLEDACHSVTVWHEMGEGEMDRQKTVGGWRNAFVIACVHQIVPNRTASSVYVWADRLYSRSQ